MNTEKVFAAIDRHFDDHVHAVQKAIQQPSVSQSNEGISEMASLVADNLRKLGASSVKVCPTAGHPIVYGELDAGARHTLMLYGMYDVQPASEDNWVVPPFSGAVHDMPELGPCIVGRGATNSKGPLVGTLNVIRAIQESGEPLPLNFIFVIEGEEEMGSRSLPAFFDGEHRPRLEQADGAFFPAFRQDRTGKAMLQMGTKGLLYFEVTCRGGEWGGPQEQGIHGAYAAWIGNPAWRLVNALSSMMDDAESIQVAGFYDEVRRTTEEEEALLETLAESFHREGPLKENVVSRFKYDGSDVDLLRHYLYDPTLNIDGIVGGYTAPGTKTQLPHKVMAKMDVRLVPDMTVDKTVERIKKHLQERGFDEIEVNILNAYQWSQMNLDDPIIQASIESYENLGAQVEIWARNVGSAPLYLFKETLGVPYVMAGMGHGERAHSNNELCTLEGLRRVEYFVAEFLETYARHLAVDVMPDSAAP